MDRPTDISPQELSEMIADLSLSDKWPSRERLCIALIEFRDMKRRWEMFAWCFPWMEKWMVRLSRKRRQSG
jgi:hypothetical protein